MQCNIPSCFKIKSLLPGLHCRTVSQKNSIINYCNELLQLTLALLEILLDDACKALLHNSECDSALVSKLAGRLCSVADDGVMFELKSSLFLLVGITTEHKVDCLKYLSYTHHEKHGPHCINDPLKKSETPVIHVDYLQHLLESSNEMDNSKKTIVTSALFSIDNMGWVSSSAMSLLTICDELLQVAVRVSYGSNNSIKSGAKAGQFQQEITDSLQALVIIDIAK